MTQSVMQRSFTGGEIAPGLGARADQARYLSGLKTCRNMIVQRHGGVCNRPGTRLVAPVKDSTDPCRLIPFIFEAADQTYLIEAGDQYFRFFWHGAPVVVTGVGAWSAVVNYVVGDLVVSAGVNYYCVVAHINQVPPNGTYWYALTGDLYEIPTPYLAADVARINTVQRADYILLAHPSYAPRLLGRVGHTNWQLTTFTTTPSLGPPTATAGVAGGGGSLTFRYVVTAAKAGTYEESYVSTVGVVAAMAAPTLLAPVTLTWAAPAGATVAEYYVYLDPAGNGIYGFIGAAQTTTFKDTGITPDFSITPPVVRVLFNSTNNYPSVAAHFQQRLILANTNAERETVWTSQVGAYTNFSISTPLQDDDAITFILASANLNPVAHIVGLRSLLVLSDAGEWVVRGDQDGVLRPAAINASQEGYIGANATARPVVIGNALIYVQARGTVVRDFSFKQDAAGFTGEDLTLFAPHLFAGYTITDLAYAQQPHSIVWAVRSDGTLLGLTYLKEQEVLGWHRHDTGASGLFESVLVLPDTPAGEDVIYVVVKRTIGGSPVRFIERFTSRQFTALEDGIFVDCSLTHDGAPITTITGLGHLEGQVIAVLGDGVVEFDGDPADPLAATYTVTGGQVTLSQAYSVIHAGIPIRFAEIETLDLDVAGTALRDKKKRLQTLDVLLEDSAPAFLAGPDATHLIRWRSELWKAAEPSATGIHSINLTVKWDEPGRVILRHDQPLPFTVLGVLPNLEVGTA